MTIRGRSPRLTPFALGRVGDPAYGRISKPVSCVTAILFAFLAVAADNPATVRSRIVFGSCLHQEKPQPIWDAVLAAKPDLFIFAGDNIYADTADMAVLRAKYKQLGDQPGYQKLLKACPVVATWDDHDYGQDDAGADYPKRDESQQIFLDFFGVPKNDPLRTQKGVYSSKIFGPPDKSVQVILLDTRYHRSPLRKKAKLIPGEGPYEPTFDKTTTLLGDEQWKWLGEELKKPAKLRLIVSSIQLGAADHGWEKWANFPHERARFFKLLQDTRAEGVIVLSGDRHFAELTAIDPGLGYPLLDFTSSGLNQGWKRWRSPESNANRLALQTHGNNFGVILIDWSQPDPTIRLQARDDEGEILFQQKLTLDFLKPGLMRSKGGPAVVTGPKGSDPKKSGPATTPTIDGKDVDADLIKASMGKEVTLTMHVARTGAPKTGSLMFLDSSADRNNALNVTIVLDKKVADQMKAAGIDNPRTHFEGKNVRVVGTLSAFQDRPQIRLSNADKISIVAE